MKRGKRGKENARERGYEGRGEERVEKKREKRRRWNRGESTACVGYKKDVQFRNFGRILLYSLLFILLLLLPALFLPHHPFPSTPKRPAPFASTSTEDRRRNNRYPTATTLFSDKSAHNQRQTYFKKEGSEIMGTTISRLV